jgi:hypothetical protein
MTNTRNKKADGRSYLGRDRARSRCGKAAAAETVFGEDWSERESMQWGMDVHSQVPQ